MDKQRFYHEVIGPFVRFMERSAEDVCVHTDHNDVTSLAITAATAAYHFHEIACREAGATTSIPPMSEALAEELRQRLSDVVDTSKHGILREPDRQTTLTSSLAFAFNQQNQFRYLRTEILANNARFGEFDVAKTLVEFIDRLGNEHGVAGLSLKITMPKRPFIKRAQVFVTNKSVFFPSNFSVKMYKRDDNDELILSDTPFELAVIQAP
jgi:hypothetical protein